MKMNDIMILSILVMCCITKNNKHKDLWVDVSITTSKNHLRR